MKLKNKFILCFLFFAFFLIFTNKVNAFEVTCNNTTYNLPELPFNSEDYDYIIARVDMSNNSFHGFLLLYCLEPFFVHKDNDITWSFKYTTTHYYRTLADSSSNWGSEQSQSSYSTNVL